jgi:hypothetical protein
MATIGMLSLLGVTLAINKGVWAGTITLFALLALFGVLLSYRQHFICTPGAVRCSAELSAAPCEGSAHHRSGGDGFGPLGDVWFL